MDEYACRIVLRPDPERRTPTGPTGTVRRIVNTTELTVVHANTRQAVG
jgi:hypothetical protein